MAKRKSKSKVFASIDLRALEEEVLAEGRDWMRKRLEEKLREKRESFSPGNEAAAEESSTAEADD